MEYTFEVCLTTYCWTFVNYKIRYAENVCVCVCVCVWGGGGGVNGLFNNYETLVDFMRNFVGSSHVQPSFQPNFHHELSYCSFQLTNIYKIPSRIRRFYPKRC